MMVSHVFVWHWIGYLLVDSKFQSSSLAHLALCVTLLQITKSSSGSNSQNGGGGGGGGSGGSGGSGRPHNNVQQVPPDAHHFIKGRNCWNVTEREWQKRTFSSSNFPVAYLSDTDCTHVIRAPINHVVQLDFRDSFKIEKYPHCEFDYIEFRDGPYGYSPLIGRFCGSLHPPILTSKSRYLWLRFHSDSSVEYTGFRAVYTYLPDNTPEADRVNVTACQLLVTPTRDQFEGPVTSDDLPREVLVHRDLYKRPTDCTWEIHIPHSHQMHLDISEIIVRTQLCTDTFIEIYDGRTVHENRVLELCSTGSNHVFSKSNILYVRLFSLPGQIVPAFSALYTLFHQGPCTEVEFDCGESVCISSTLLCNDRKNCASNTDEMDCGVTTQAVNEVIQGPTIFGYHTILLGVIGGLLLVFLIVCILITCLQRNNGVSGKKLDQLRKLSQIEEYDASVAQIELSNHSPSVASRRSCNSINRKGSCKNLDYTYLDGIVSTPRKKRNSLCRTNSTGNHVPKSRYSVGTQTPPIRRTVHYSRSSSLEDISDSEFRWTRTPRYYQPQTVPITVTIEPRYHTSERQRLSTFLDHSKPLINSGRSKSVKDHLSNHVGQTVPDSLHLPDDVRNRTSCPELRWQCPVRSNECPV